MLFAMLAVTVLTAETLGFYAAGFRYDGKNRELRTYLFVDHYRQVATIILDADNNWFIDENEVTIVHINTIEGKQGHAMYQGNGVIITINGTRAELILEGGYEINLRATALVPVE